MEALFTLDDWKRLPEGFPAQLFDGSLVRDAAPTYGHQQLVGRIYLHLVQRLGENLVVLAPTDVVIDRLNVVQPDVCVLRRAPPRDSHDVGIPRIAFEVLSPTTRKRDREVKALKLIAAGVVEVWFVDGERRTIEIRTTNGTVPYRGAEVARSHALAEIEFVPDDLFAVESDP